MLQVQVKVVTPDGQYRTVNECQDKDLFWALRGGGGGTFGVVTSTIVRAHPKLPVVTSFFSFETSDAVSADAFFAGLRAYLDHFIAFTDAHTYGYFYVTPGFDDGRNNTYRFEMVPFFAPNHTTASFEALVAPFFARFFVVQDRSASTRLRRDLGWQPTAPGLLADITEGSYVDVARSLAASAAAAAKQS